MELADDTTRIARLEQQVELLRAAIATDRDGAAGGHDASDDATTRRSIIKLTGATLAGAAMAAVAGRASLASAANGESVTVGEVVASTNQGDITQLNGLLRVAIDSTAEVGPSVSGGFAGAVTGWERADNFGDQVQRGGVYGYAGGSANGVVGLVDIGSLGAGVLGYSNSINPISAGVSASSKFGPALQLIATRTGRPGVGTWTLGALVPDQNGALWYCTRSSDAGVATWLDLTSRAPEYDAVTAGDVTTTTFTAKGPLTATTITAADLQATAIHSNTVQTGAVYAGTVQAGTLTSESMSAASLVLQLHGGYGAPVSGSWSAGTLVADSGGHLWFCTLSGQPGTWVDLAAPGSGIPASPVPPATPGLVPTFHPVVPARIYDSRVMAPAGLLSAGDRRTITVRDSVAVGSGAIVDRDVVPAGATAISANVTVVGTVGAGFLAVNPKGDGSVHAATINWYASDQVLNNGVTLTLGGDRELTVVAGGSVGAGTHVVIDVTGYFR
jgi:hypothetical protein